MIKKLIDTIEIKRDKNYNIEITNVKFTEEFISKSSKDYINYLYQIMKNNNIGLIYKEAITKQELEQLQEDYFIFSNTKMANNEYDNATLAIYNKLLKQNFYAYGIINCPYIIFVSAKIMEMNSAQQNKVALYPFNSINFKIKNYKSLDTNKCFKII